MNQTDTICAIATAQGGAIGIIRISGTLAIKATSKIFHPIGKKTLAEREAYKQIYGEIHSEKGEVIDEVLVSLFRAPHSYTGEDSVEISCHGSSYILQKVIHLLIKQGCRLAQPGEYTQRAFLNGKIDLSQAEAVADLIASSSEASHRLAMNQMKGAFSKELLLLRNKLLHLTSLMELELDFSDHEELEFADRDELHKIANSIEQTVQRLVNSFSVGNALKNGIPVAIVGETNVGKSTLLNALIGEDKAIVSNIHGTTRDIIEDTITLNGILFRFIDTAGIRQTTDIIENLGIERSYKKMEQANIVLWIIDSTNIFESKKLSDKIIPLCKDKNLIILFNKSEIISDSEKESIIQQFKDVEVPKLFLSAKELQNLDELENLLIKTASLPEISQNDVIVSNIRHYEALSRALESIQRVQEGLQMQLSGDFISQDLRECIHHLSEIVGGEISTEEVLGNIFKNFCIGK